MPFGLHAGLYQNGGWQKAGLLLRGGSAPFEYRSGTSIMGRTGVSKFANKELKHVLHMAALSSIRYNGEMRTYFERKVSEGKNKMSVLNAVRNKLLHLVVAVVKIGTPYELKLNNI